MVLVAGGITTGLGNLTSALTSSHLYDPKRNVWIATGPLPIGVGNPHAFMRAIVLRNGQVLIAGGEDDDSIRGQIATGVLVHSRKSYLFILNEKNPARSSWDYTRLKSDGSISLMPEGRTTSALVLLDSGSVLNVGGLGPAYNGAEAATNTASIFDPTTGRWIKVAPMPPVFGIGEDEVITQYPTAPGSRWAPFSAKLDNGEVLIAGGSAGVFIEAFRRSALIYSPSRDSWRVTNPMHYYYWNGFWSGKLTRDAGVLFAGPGTSSTGALVTMSGEIYHPENATWVLAPANGGPPADGSVDSFAGKMLVLQDGSVQTTGGADNNTESIGISGSWVFDSQSNR